MPSSFTPESDRHGAKSGAEFGPEFAPASNPTAGAALNPADPVGYEYQVGGSLPAYSPTYVQRQGDLDLYTKIKASQFCYVFNSRQMGKSSLRVRTMERLRQDGIACAALELSQIGSQQIKPETWYAGFIRSVIFSLRGGDAAGERAVRSLRESFNLRTWWRERDWLPPVQRFTEFLETVLLCAVPSQIVIFVDEIDSVLRLPFKDDFFAVLRSCYNCRSDRPELRRLSFVLLGVAAPASLIQDKSRTPFNIGHAIDLTGFQPGEIGPLQAGWTCEQDLADRLGAAVLAWTGGQPFLTQKVCHWIAQALPQDPHPSPLPGGEGTGEDRVSYSPRPLGEGPGVRDLLRPLGEGPGVREPEVWVAQLIQTRLLENWENQDEPQHLRTIRDRLLLNEAKAVKLLGLYEQILIQGSIQADDSLEQIELRLSGLVVQRWGQLRVYNRVYAWVFDRAWVQESLAHLRPEFYGQALGRWLAQPEGDPKALLQGQDLQGAQQWAAGKQLSIGDYRFLAACQEAEVRRILATAEQQAKWTVYRGFSTLLAMAAMAIMGVLWSGYAVQQAQQVTEIERQTQQALQQFEFKQLESLLLATRSARTLAELFDPDRPPATYPTLSPLLALQQILSTVREQNQIRWHQGPVVTVAFSPDGQRILTGSQDGTAKLWSLQGELLATLDPTLACDEALGCPATPDLATPSSQAVPPPSPLTDPLPAAISDTTPAVPPAISPPATHTLAPDRNPPVTPASPPLP
ncbi:MAG: AAA-like domain-containing protein, partial [Prochlorothrix sp.]